jgi:hypothetical protein
LQAAECARRRGSSLAARQHNSKVLRAHLDVVRPPAEALADKERTWAAGSELLEAFAGARRELHAAA